MWEELCLGLVIFACIGVIIYLLTRSKDPVSFTKEVSGGNVNLKIKANRDVRRIEVRCGEGPDEAKLARSGLKKGEVVEFTFPLSENKVQIVVQEDKGKTVLNA